MNKLKEVIAYIAKKYPKEDELSNARLTKLIYLADWHQSINYQSQISPINWYFDNYGPFVKDVFNVVVDCSDTFEIRNTTNIFGNEKKLIKLKDVGYNPLINVNEMQSIDHIIEITHKLNWTDFIRLVYSTYPIVSSDRYSYINLIEKANEYKNQKI